MVPIPSGAFMLGTTNKKIEISAFWMGAFEVTRDEFNVFFDDENTSQNVSQDAITRPSPQYVDLTWGMGKEGGYPANSMSQLAALMYCKWLYQKTKVFYRLPTEAEWEYASKAGAKTDYFYGNNANDLGKYAWYQKNSKEAYHKVGQKLPNPWGLYDILGNVLEWTLDHYSETTYATIAAKDPMVLANVSKYPKVLRGGSYEDDAMHLKNNTRFHSDPIWNRRDPQIPKSKWWLTEAKQVGFRLVRPKVQPSETEVNDFFNQYIHL
jgi:formylglycine-generating enzyme required for sulfatase activity